VPRIKLLAVRVSAGEYLRLAAAAEAAGLAPSAWVRHQALHAADLRPEPAPHFQPPPAASVASVATAAASAASATAAAPPARLARTAGTRFTTEHLEALADHARACGLTRAAYIRQVVLGVTPAARRPLSHAAIVAVNRVGNNLNQLVHLAHTGVVLPPDLRRAVEEVRRTVQALRDTLLSADLADPTAPAAPPQHRAAPAAPPAPAGSSQPPLPPPPPPPPPEPPK
jgi:hypothetical protein